ncbi:MAG: hypothetical protein O6941_09140 [Planctomycetota bacterium]|nr:hypothetical protein [Planctomycetota bacterium]
MSTMRSTPQQVNLAQHEGWALFSAAEAMLKGALEAETVVKLLTGPRSESFSSLFDLGGDRLVSQLLHTHGTSLLATPDASRGVTLAAHAAVSAHQAFALVPNDQLDITMPAISRACGCSFDSGGAMCLVLEDDPQNCRASCPRRAAIRLDLPCIEPTGVAQLRDAMEQGLRLSRAGRGVVAMVVHRRILRAIETLDARPNRVTDPVHTPIVHRDRRGPRWAETGGVLRMARRLEMNLTTSAPSPGERLPVGFIVIGAAAPAMFHLIHVLRLHGRVPVLQLGLVHPIDDSIVQRLLGRCEQVVVLEPRPGSIETGVLGVCESMRSRGEQPAVVWSRTLPPDPAGTAQVMRPDGALHPSALAAKIVHLLRTIRPGLVVASPPVSNLLLPGRAVPPRGIELGSVGALAQIRSVLADVDQWLRDQSAIDEGSAEAPEPTALAIDGIEPIGAPGRVVRVETWPYQRFLFEGSASLQQAASDDGSWIFVISSIGAADGQDVQRMVRGAAPVARADRVRIELADLNDRAALQDLLRALTLLDQLSVVIVRDGPPARYDVAAMERSRAEVDRLGYEPSQRAVWPAEEACAIRHPADPMRSLPSHASSSAAMRTQFSVVRTSQSRPDTVQRRIRIRPLLEQAEVVRARPPASTWQDARGARLARPKPLHASQSQWRAHLAGFRGQAPGVAAWALCEAGRIMGYQVRSLNDPTPIGPGLRAWAQVLFARPGRDQAPVPVTAAIPYGEADLFLGLELREALRGIEPGGSLRVASPDRTWVIVNSGPCEGQRDAQPPAEFAAQAAPALLAVCRPQSPLIEDFARACRSAFHTDRVVDLALLGAAFQRGLIPVTPDAIEAALQQVEARGFGRANEAFHFGCHLAVDGRQFARCNATCADEAPRIVRRTILLLKRRRRAGTRSGTARLARILEQTLAQMPGLAETDLGRHARRDLVIALQHCLAWGGLAYAQRYADLVTALYLADRGDQGRAVTRSAILPLAEAMLIRDPIYIATMATSAEQRRRARQWLNVKMARGDRLERRFLTRIELVAFRRRIRLDIRSSLWPAQLVACARHWMPQRWRGTLRERQIREYLIDVTQRAARGATHDYQQWSETMQRLHDQALADRLRDMALAELRMLIEPDPQPAAEPQRLAAGASGPRGIRASG